ncbi:hypothetical protein PTSG_09220 [Salpingoeca rosetta]|uniref:Uncharacterized protein n=1 Tax=Salpingoeca rosetta (strain ATCC 50818 / BSB-021) TaxID=946362 RepID=F2UN23_SALR5|nr:uncharacterized protein PTSG_09220 [Salpingoeca rosetta]EGD78522.1 hypothetical protein PTSG_09220 [Salpingoeca rosetta]|eukprot:XP_004989471.1 hypothetical protein PTSG_09220 [Salpingoeca rosetta]
MRREMEMQVQQDRIDQDVAHLLHQQQQWHWQQQQQQQQQQHWHWQQSVAWVQREVQQHDGHDFCHHRNRRRHRHRHHPRTRPSFASMHPVMAQALSGMREMWSPWHQHQQEEDTRGHNDDTALLLLEENMVPGPSQPRSIPWT